MFSRDSILLWVGFAGSIIAYLVTAKTPPTQWDYQGWLQFASILVAWVAGKLASSPLPGKDEGKP